MRVYKLLPLAAAVATAIVIPDEQVMSNIDTGSASRGKLSQWKDSISHAIDNAKHAVDDAFDAALDETRGAADKLSDYVEEEYSEAESWAKSFRDAHQPDLEAFSEPLSSFSSMNLLKELEHKTKSWYKDLGISHRPCPHREAEGDDDDGHDDHHGKKPRRPHHPPGHHKPNLTVYQMIKKSKYTTKLAKLVDQFPDVVEKLNGSESNFTFFAPTDKAFERVGDHKPSKEFLLKVLQYHVVPEVYPAFRVLKANTLPTVLGGEGLSDNPTKQPQRLAVRLSLVKGLSINFYSRVIAINIFGTNGVIHAVDSLLVPPPKAATIVQTFPGAFSTLELALWKTGLINTLNDTSSHLGGTLFVPNNDAWARLGPRANAFLFSKYGQKYLKALVKYHIVPSKTLYSDNLYTAHPHKPDADDDDDSVDASRTFHINLPTLLKGYSLSIDVARWTRFVDIRINGFYNVAVQNAPAYDGVLQIMTNVLIPPKGHHGSKVDLDTDDISVDELKERLQPFVEEDDEYDVADVKLEDFQREQLPMGLPMEL